MTTRCLLGTFLFLSAGVLFNGCASPAPLMDSSREGNAQKVIAQLAAGADPNMQDSEGVTPLMVAAGHGGLDLTAGSRGELTYNDRQKSDGSVETVQALLDAGARYDTADKHGQTALWYGAYHGNPQVMLILLNAGAVPNRANNDGQTPLAAAASQGHEACVAQLLQRKVNVDTRSKEHGRTPLITASYVGAEGCVRMLLESGADVNLVDNDGHGALQNAVFNGHMAVVKLLLLNGAPVNARAKDGTTPLGTAISRGQDAIAELLRQEGGSK